MKLLIFFIIILLFNKNIFAQNFFDTEFHEIKFVSQNIDEDKKEKITDIKYISINKIFKNILLDEDYKKIKKKINEDFINYLIKNIQIEDEKIVNNNYYSNIKINFNKKKIIQYLRDNKLNYIEFIPEDFFIIIIQQEGLIKNMFTKNNDYYNYLLINNFQSFYKIPNLDVNDRFLLDIEDINNRNFYKINKFLDKYSKKNSILVFSNKINKNIEYKFYYYEDNQFIELKEYTYDDNDYNKFFKQLKIDIINKWKSINYIQNEKLNDIYCEITYFNLPELKQILITIDNITTINEIALKSIAFQKNDYTLDFFGTTDLLPILFNQNGLDIKIEKDDCRISLK